MKKCVLKYPVYTFDHKQLLPAGANLSEETMREVCRCGSGNRFASVKFMEFKTMKKDIQDLMSVAPYHVVFSDGQNRDYVLRSMNEITIIEPVLASLGYFKENDFYTYRHILMVFATSILLSRELMRDQLDLKQGALASPAHDFGKICIPLDILKKTKLLTTAERKAIEHHTLAGYVLLQYYMGDADNLAAIVARDHHEKKNATGYPRGIRLENPLVEIVAVGDIYDALISPRPYRPVSYDNRSALEEITAKAERGELSWNVVKALIACNRKNKPHYSQCDISKIRRGGSPEGNNYGMLDKEEN